MSRYSIEFRKANVYRTVAPQGGILDAASSQNAAKRLLDPAATAAPAVMIFGQDLVLLQTRKLLLSRHGYSVRISVDLEEVERSLRAEPIRLLILCHSLNQEDAAHALALADSTLSIPSLILISGKYGYADCGPGEVLNVLEGPERLAFVVDKLLNSAESCKRQECSAVS